MFLSSGCVLTTFLTTYIAESNRPKSQKHMMFLVQAGTFLCFQARRSSATRSSASDLTVHQQHFFCGCWCNFFQRPPPPPPLLSQPTLARYMLQWIPFVMFETLNSCRRKLVCAKIMPNVGKICRCVPSSPISKRIRKGSSFPRKSA